MNESLPGENSADPTSSPSQAVAWIIRLLAAVAAGVAGYLMMISLQNKGLPAGCGDGSGCAEVLTSKWSNIFGLPVSVPAFAIYLGIILASFWIVSKSIATQQRGWNILLTLAALVAGAAVWFIGVQLIAIKQICPWCMADHTLGLITAAVAFVAAPRGARSATSETSGSLLAPSRTAAIVVGLSGTLLFASVQHFTGKETSAIGRLAKDANDDTGPGPDRAVGVLQGILQIKVAEEPIIGSPTAPTLIVMLFDYACPHCRRSHQYLTEIMDENPGKFALVAMPMPLDGKCNPTVRPTKERFKNSCELASFALSVWYAKPEAFAEYDKWLFEPSSPRERLEAKNKARDLIGDRLVFNAMLEDPRITETLLRNITAYTEGKCERIPVIMSPGFSSIIGKPESKEHLWEILESELLGKPHPDSELDEGDEEEEENNESEAEPEKEPAPTNEASE